MLASFPILRYQEKIEVWDDSKYLSYMITDLDGYTSPMIIEEVEENIPYILKIKCNNVRWVPIEGSLVTYHDMITFDYYGSFRFSVEEVAINHSDIVLTVMFIRRGSTVYKNYISGYSDDWVGGGGGGVRTTSVVESGLISTPYGTIVSPDNVGFYTHTISLSKDIDLILDGNNLAVSFNGTATTFAGNVENDPFNNIEAGYNMYGTYYVDMRYKLIKIKDL